MHQVFFLALRNQLGVVALVKCAEAVRENRRPRSQHPVAPLACHEDGESHGGNNADPCRVNWKPRPVNHVDDREPGRAESPLRIEDQLDEVAILLDVDLNDFLADKLCRSLVDFTGHEDDSVIIQSFLFCSVFPRHECPPLLGDKTWVRVCRDIPVLTGLSLKTPLQTFRESTKYFPFGSPGFKRVWATTPPRKKTR